MPVVVFESAETGVPDVEALAPGGTRLVDLCDERNAPVPFSCRSASCGTCRIDVLEGADLLEPPRDEELDVLDIFGDDPARRRLCCQARVRDGSGRIRVRPADP
ncbi:MAG TPA: 2Fe-2S iron-sulfur cluster-binding protein [Polyangiaceae bacterium]|nr:2Fe-2S iron-sulfur cluster-binding protein [Polyangiaceae bacterium]